MSQLTIWRILDAALNRAGEGLRVVEDYVRFVAEDAFLTAEVKELRHDLAAAAMLVTATDRNAARDTLTDVGTGVSAPSEGQRRDSWDVCAASFKRSEQSLRSLEEFGKLANADFADRCESLRYRLYTLEKAIDIGRTSGELLEDVRLCVLVDCRDSAADFEQLAAALIEARVGMIQLRDKQLDDRELVERGLLLRQLTRGTTTLAIVNDRADIAAAVDADGVHLGQEDLKVKDARAIVGTRALVGISTHNIKQARAAVLDGANYLGAGPSFPSRTKSFEDFSGPEFLREIAAEIRLPTFAIGGISIDNLADVLATGIGRVAVGGALMNAKDPGSAARALLCMLKSSTVQTVSPSGSRT
ncbi:MAG TPA: thiamine phosphate synthase [Lacipirellulaceae bacterium]|jgi:thiamine-phosphate pyrophosphorylase